MNNYKDFVIESVNNFEQASRLPLKTAESVFDCIETKSDNSLSGKTILIFAPHPDDECIVGLLPLRLMAEAGIKVVDVAITLGSKLERRQERLQELSQACKYLNWNLRVCGQDGFENIKLSTKENNFQYWDKCVDELVEIIKEYNPIAIFFPHIDDWNATHIGTSQLLTDAVEKLQYAGLVVNTEYWGGIREANLMVEASADYIAVQMQALARHVKEIERNDYHLRLPSWMCDNVRRGTELVGGQGAAAPHFNFATLYNVLKLKDGKLQQHFKNRFLPLSENAKNIL